MVKPLALRPRRSALFVPASHVRALEKAKKLEADLLIFDLEDGVGDAAKSSARNALEQALNDSDASIAFEKLVRINGLNSEWWQADAAMLRAQKAGVVDGVVLPKAEAAQEVDAFYAATKMPVWANIETPLGILQAEAIAAHPACVGIIAGTNDLRLGLGLSHQKNRAPLMHSLYRLILAARAYGCVVLDGTFIELDDAEGLQAEARQGAAMGFDGKTLIHPKQIAVAHSAFGPDEAAYLHAKALQNTYAQAAHKGEAVTVFDGQMIEALHAERARHIILLYEMIANKT